MIKKLSLLLFAMIAMSSCTGFNLIKKDPKARFIVAAQTFNAVGNSLADLREAGHISDKDWQNIKLAVITAGDYFKQWKLDLDAGKLDSNIERVAMTALRAMENYQVTHKKKAE